MKKVVAPVIAGLLALSLMVISAFVPWFEWSYQAGPRVWYEKSSVWGPAAVYSYGRFHGPTYASVDVPVVYAELVDRMAIAYLVLFLLGIGMWIALLLVLGNKFLRRRVSVALGIGSVGASVGLVGLLGLGGLIAQRVGLYAAIRTSEIIEAQFVNFEAVGLLMFFVGLVMEAAALIRGHQTRRV